MHRIRHLPFALALKSAKSLHLPALPSANANVFAIRFSVKICKACGEGAAFAIANSLRIGKACGEC
jgi:hypothetical protein